MIPNKTYSQIYSANQHIQNQTPSQKLFISLSTQSKTALYQVHKQLKYSNNTLSNIT